jgi:hypothetical protein
MEGDSLIPVSDEATALEGGTAEEGCVAEGTSSLATATNVDSEGRDVHSRCVALVVLLCCFLC